MSNLDSMERKLREKMMTMTMMLMLNKMVVALFVAVCGPHFSLMIVGDWR